MSMLSLEPPALREADHRVEGPAGGLFVKECGPARPTQIAPPLLMLHGACHGWWVWRKWQPFFAAAGWRTFAMSLRNHSGSDPVPEADYLRLSVRDYVADVLAVCRWLGRPPALMGHSMGGIVAQKAAEEADLAALIPVAAIGPAQLGRQNPAEIDPGRPIMHAPDAARRRWFHEDLPDDLFARFYAALVPESPGVMRETGMGRTPVDPTRIGCPVLCVGGEHDATYVPRADRLAAVYGGDWIAVPDAGHNMMLESMALDVAQRINQWLLSKIDLPRVPAPRPAHLEL